MNRLPEFDPIVQSLAEVKSAVIFIPENPIFDLVAASLSLFLSLEKAGRNISLVCSSPMTVGFSQLIGVNRISDKIGGRNLVISFDYLENAIDKVSYNIENKKFNLVIQPKPGFSPLSPENVNYSHLGELELSVVIGARSLDSLGKIYQQEAKFFNQGQILNIDIGPANSRFGKVNAVFANASSYCEVIAALMGEAKYPLDRDIASNLLLGIQEATNNFASPKTNPMAFEAAAFCLRNGAQLRPVFPRALKPKLRRKKPLSLKAMSKNESAARPPEEARSKPPEPDWFGPKVFRGTKRI